MRCTQTGVTRNEAARLCAHEHAGLKMLRFCVILRQYKGTKANVSLKATLFFFPDSRKHLHSAQTEGLREDDLVISRITVCVPP